MILIIIKIILLSLSGISNSMMDTLHVNRYFNSILIKLKPEKFWNPAISSYNKWKNGDKNQGEKFLGSSTIFVWLTDGWHLCKTIMLFFLCVALCMDAVIISVYIDWLIYLLVFGFSFEVSFRILNKKKLIK